MKKLMLGVLIGAAGLYGLQHLRHPRAAVEAGGADGQESPQEESTSTAAALSTEKVAFRCDGRVYCSQMKSYDEAVYFLRNCPDVKMDGDNDGIPCEQQFSK